MMTKRYILLLLAPFFALYANHFDTICPILDLYDRPISILVLGDSIAMGWGVNDYETFSYLLEKNLKMKVYNLGVSSYGTIREIKMNNPFYSIYQKMHSN